MAEAEAQTFIDSLLKFDGQLGRLVARHDWTQTPIGPIDGWPESLKTALNIVLLSPVPMVLLWGEAGVMLYNDAYATFAGGRHPALLGSNVREGWAEAADFNDNVMRVGLSGGRLAYRNQVLTLRRHNEPEQVFMNLDYSPVLGENGLPAGVLGIVVETTENVAATRALAAERDRGTEILESISDAFYAVDSDWRFTYVNRKAEEWWGRPATNLLGKHYWTEFPQAVGSEAYDAHQSAMRDRTSVRLETVSPILKRRVGIDIHPTASGGLSVYFRDIEHLKLAEETQRDSDARLAAIFAGATVGLSEIDRDGRFLRVNEELCRILGRERDELLCMSVVDVTHPDSAGPSERAIAGALATGTPSSLDKRYVRPDGSTVWANSRVSRLNDNGQSGNLLVVTVELTERLAAEERVRESEARYRQIVEGAEDFAIATVDEQGAVTSWNTGAARITGFRERDIVGRSGELIFTPEDRAAGAPDHELNRAKSDGRSLNERWHMRRDGGRFWGSGLTMRLDQPGGGYLKIFRDRTAEHEAEAQLRQAQAALAAEVDALGRLQDVSTRLIADDTPQSVYDAILTAATDLMGSECASIQMLNTSGDLELLAHRGYDPRSVAYWQTVRSTSGSTCGIAMTTGGRVVVPDVEDSDLPAESGDLQSYRWTGMRAVQSTPLFSRSGKPIGMISTHWKRPHTPPERDLKLFDVLARQAADAIERTAAQADLRESQERQAFLLSLSDAVRLLKSPVEIASIAAEHICERFVLSRVFYAEFFGSVMRVERDYTRGVGSLVGEHELEAFGPDLLRAYHETSIVKIDDVRTDDRLSEDARSGLLTRQVGAYLDVVLFQEEHWVSVLALQSATPREWTSSEESLAREIGERLKAAIQRARAEDQLRELNETLERRVAEASADLDRVWHNASDMFVVIDGQGTFRRINPATTTILGWTEADMLGQSVFEFIHSDDLAPTSGALEHTRTDVPPTFENRYRAKDGNFRTISWTAASEGALIYAYGRDVTDERERQTELEAAQEALRQSQKMEAMGQLTGGVAHDFNNLLTPIVGSLDMLQRKGIGNEREQRLIAGAAQSAERAKTLVQRLLAFARRQPLQPVPVDIAKLVQGMGELVSSTTGPQIEVVVQAQHDLPAAKADPNQLEMALLNLAVNARDAMSNGGALRISATAEKIGAGHRSGLMPDTYVKLAVADTGIGMDEATLARAIEPFFSTKGVGKGTGLGLSMAHGLASQLGGALTIQSRPMLGTNIELWLPQSGAVPKQPGQVEESTIAPAHRGTALLVDDEELVRMSTADMLADLGYAVIEAASGEEAMRIIEQGENFDLLLTDHLMPGINGTDLVRAVRLIKPTVPVLLVSGYAENEGVNPDLPRLTKPFRKDELASSLAHLPELS